MACDDTEAARQRDRGREAERQRQRGREAERQGDTGREAERQSGRSAWNMGEVCVCARAPVLPSHFR